LEKSTLIINKIPIIIKTINAIGEITEMKLFMDNPRLAVTNPTIYIKTSTPKTTIKPDILVNLFLFSMPGLFAKKARNPG